MRHRTPFTAAWIALLLLRAAPSHGQMYDPIEILPREVGKTVSELPNDEDFSKPELAYATIHRQLAAGTCDWRAVSVARLAPRLPPAPDQSRSVSEVAASGWLNARIVEVRMVSETIAYVIGQWPTSKSFDVRGFELENGKWLNLSNSQADTIEQARRIVENAAANRRSAATWRKRTTYPADYIKPFNEFLARSGVDPKELLIRSLADHKLVAIGEIHHRPTYWRLNSDLVSNPRFAEHVGTIYLELPSHGQPLVDRFLAADSLDTAPIIDVLRDVLWMGRPDEAMLDFFVAAWNTNRELPKDRRIRIVLVDVPRPWKQVRRRGDWKAYDINRDEHMARLVLADMQANQADGRGALLIAGYTHLAKNLRWQETNEPIMTAGWRLSRALGADCFTFIQHGPQISSSGRVYGRAARGLFDSAFSNNDHKPVAFLLSQSPFGGEPFDCAIDWNSAGLFQDAFDGYIFLERLEDEWFSPLIADFYTDDFIREIDRRHRMMEDKSLAEMLGLDEVDSRAFIRWMSNDWGAPRNWRDHLGSIDAWRIGDEMPMDR